MRCTGQEMLPCNNEQKSPLVRELTKAESVLVGLAEGRFGKFVAPATDSDFDTCTQNSKSRILVKSYAFQEVIFLCRSLNVLYRVRGNSTVAHFYTKWGEGKISLLFVLVNVCTIKICHL